MKSKINLFFVLLALLTTGCASNDSETSKPSNSASEEILPLPSSEEKDPTPSSEEKEPVLHTVTIGLDHLENYGLTAEEALRDHPEKFNKAFELDNGVEVLSSYSETLAYSFKYVGFREIWPSKEPGVGNCLKLGSSKATGEITFNFLVPIKEMKIKACAYHKNYKDYTSEDPNAAVANVDTNSSLIASYKTLDNLDYVNNVITKLTLDNDGYSQFHDITLGSKEGKGFNKVTLTGDGGRVMIHELTLTF